jgi:hypothetical protein
MTDKVSIRRILRAAVGTLLFPLGVVGCQHTHVATTQVAVIHESSTQTATTEVAAPESAIPATTQAIPPARLQATSGVGQKFAQGTRTVGHDVAQGTRAVGHDLAQGTRAVGHGVAEGSRNTYHAAASGVRAVGGGVADLTTNSVQGIRNTPPESLSAPVIDVDAAMQVRDWDQVTAQYKSGATVAGPIGFLYEPKGDQSEWRYGVIETPLFLFNTALLPYAFCKTPPWEPVEWKAATVAPTYTAVPPLPPLP